MLVESVHSVLAGTSAAAARSSLVRRVEHHVGQRGVTPRQDLSLGAPHLACVAGQGMGQGAVVPWGIGRAAVWSHDAEARIDGPTQGY